MIKHTLLLAGLLFLPLSASAQDLHRFYSDSFNGHFYTDSVAERDSVFGNSDWAYEGVAYRTSTATDDVSVFRFWSEAYKHHFFTTSVFERDAIIATDANWSYEGEVFQVASTGFPIYRFYSPVFRGHFYTGSVPEKEYLETSDPNWNYEGIAWYVTELGEDITPLADVVRGVARKAEIFGGVDTTGYPAQDALRVHLVSGGVLASGASVLDQQLWGLFAELAPSSEILAQIGEFALYYEDSSASANVATIGSLQEWRITFNVDTLTYFPSVPETIVHEYGHIMAVQPDQVITVEDDINIGATCTSYYRNGICYLAGSYLNTFRAFWQNDGAPYADDANSSERSTYYDAHKDEFVSDYAGTSFSEDFAETLTYSVFGAVGDVGARAREKVYRTQVFPALSSYRSDVRRIISTW